MTRNDQEKCLASISLHISTVYTVQGTGTAKLCVTN